MISDVQTRRTGEYAVTQRAATPVAERPARALRGLRMLTLGLAVLAAGIVVLWHTYATIQNPAPAVVSAAT